MPCAPKPSVWNSWLTWSSLLIFPNSCWVHLGLLTMHSLQHKRWTELRSRGTQVFLFEVFLFACFLWGCIAFAYFFSIPCQSQAKLESWVLLVLCLYHYTLYILKCLHIFLHEEARLLATSLQFVEELVKPRPKYGVRHLQSQHLIVEEMRLKVQSYPLCISSSRAVWTTWHKNCVWGEREGREQMFLEIDFQG